MVDFRKRRYPEGEIRNRIAARRRAAASEYSNTHAAVPTEVDVDETELEADGFGTSFTKGLPHDEFGKVVDGAHHVAFVNRIDLPVSSAAPVDGEAGGVTDGDDAARASAASSALCRRVSRRWRHREIGPVGSRRRCGPRSARRAATWPAATGLS